MSAADIHLLITEVYSTETMSGSKARKWVRKFKDGRTNIHDEERSDRPSVITDDLMQAVETKIRENRRFTITTLSLEFPDDYRSVVYKIVTEDLNFKKLCYRWAPRLLIVEHKETRFALSLDFLIRYEEEMLSRIVIGIKATVDEMATHILSRQDQSQTNAVKVQDYGNSVLRPARCFTGELYATRNNDQLRCLLHNCTDALKSIAKQTAWHAVKRCFAPPR
ncbi:HTH_48 domain-containing protein [Trichonephila clavipes]|nr:HTH_48 domain-containing protein [Trichonephila clavipes]